MGHVFKVCQLFLQVLLHLDQLGLFIVTILELFNKEPLFVLQKVLPVDEPLQFLPILRDFSFELVVATHQLIFFIL